MTVWVLEYDNPYPIALAPKDVCALPDVRLHRRKQSALERLLIDIALLHVLLRMPANGHIAEFRDVTVELGDMVVVIVHARLERAEGYRKRGLAQSGQHYGLANTTRSRASLSVLRFQSICRCKSMLPRCHIHPVPMLATL